MVFDLDVVCLFYSRALYGSFAILGERRASQLQTATICIGTLRRSGNLILEKSFRISQYLMVNFIIKFFSIEFYFGFLFFVVC